MKLGVVVQLTLEAYQAQKAESSQQTYRSHANHILSRWGEDREFDSLSRLEIQSWVDERADSIAAASVIHECAFLSKCYKIARRHGFEITSPMPSVDKPSVDNARTRIPTPQEWAAIQDAMDPWDFTLPEFSKHTLVRRAELMGLKCSNIRLAKALEVVNPETGLLTPLYIGVARIEDSKTGKPRDCPLNYTAAGIALQWMNKDDRGDAEHLFLPHLNPDNRIAAGKDWAERIWYAVLDRLGITNLHWHDIRHLGATLAFVNGATIGQISKMLGHKSIKQTERYINVVDLYEMWPAAIAVGKGFLKASAVPPELAEYAPLLAASGLVF